MPRRRKPAEVKLHYFLIVPILLLLVHHYLIHPELVGLDRFFQLNDILAPSHEALILTLFGLFVGWEAYSRWGEEMGRRNAPLGIMILAGLYALVGILAIVVGAAGIALAGVGFGLTGASAIVLGLLTLAIAYGLYLMRAWAWWFAFVTTSFSFITSIAVPNIASAALSLVLNAVIVVYLYMVRGRYNVRFKLSDIWKMR